MRSIPGKSITLWVTSVLLNLSHLLIRRTNDHLFPGEFHQLLEYSHFKTYSLSHPIPIQFQSRIIVQNTRTCKIPHKSIEYLILLHHHKTSDFVLQFTFETYATVSPVSPLPQQPTPVKFILIQYKREPLRRRLHTLCSKNR